MERLTTYAGWFLGMVTLAVSILLYAELQSVRQQLAAASERTGTRAQMPDSETAARLKRAQERIAKLEDELASAKSALAEAAEESAPTMDPGSLLENMLAGAGQSAEDAPPAREPSGEGGMLGGVPEERMIDPGTGMQVSMVYGEFLRELGLAPEQDAAVRAALGEYLQKQTQAAAYMRETPQNRDTILADLEDARSMMRSELAGILSPEELAYFDEYEAVLPARQLAESMETQLNALAAGLTHDNRQLLIDLMVEEMFATPHATNQNTLLLLPEAAFQMQHDAYLRMLERAGEYMEPEQYAIAEDFVHQQVETFASLLEGYQGGDSGLGGGGAP
jgi:hypothetical protein